MTKRWVKTRIEEHNICKKSISGQVLNETARFYLSTCVIDVRPRVGTEEPRLFESRGAALAQGYLKSLLGQSGTWAAPDSKLKHSTVL